jgi:predicted ATPase
VTILAFRSVALWVLGYPVSAQADAEDALSNARETVHAVTLMYALTHVSMTHFCCGNYTTASAEADELVALAGEKGSRIWKAYGASRQGFLAAMTDKAADAVQIITSAIDTARLTGSTLWTPLNLSHLARAYAALGKFDEAWRCIGEAMTAMATAKETWWEAEVHRIAGKIAWKSPEPDVAKAQTYFERALAVARQQQAKSWELRASMSLARLWRDQSKVQQARELLAPVYGWFTEGFDTRDLKDAKALLDELAA